LAKKRGHGEGSISQRKDGRWMGQITLGINPATKKAKRLTFYGKTRKEVQEKIREALNQKDKGMLSEPSKLTLQEWLKTWLEDYKQRELKESTWESYKSLIEDYINPDLGMVKLSKLRTNDIQRFYNEKLTNGRKRNVKKDGEEITGLSTRTVKYIHTVLSGALKQAVKEGLIPANPADATTQPRQVKKEITPLSAEQVRYFLDNIKANWLYPVFVTDLGTGLRRGELLGLKWDVVNLKDGTATIRRSLIQVKGKVFLQEDTKTKSSTATVKLPNTVVKELRKVKKQQAQYKLILGKAYQDSDFVFTWPDGRYIRPDYLYHQYKNLLKENGLPDTRFHDLRHTFCTMLLESGEELSTVSKLARHSSFSITADIYGHLTTNMQNQAAEKIDAILKIK
jgi:integrase